MKIVMRNKTAIYLLSAALFVCAHASAQMFGGGGEILADTILELEDLHAQCIKPEERAVFEYAKALKRLEWYRYEYFSEVDEKKVSILAGGIVQKDTGEPKFAGYRDIRDVSAHAGTGEDPYALTPSNFKNIYWHSRPKPKYSGKDCQRQTKRWLSKAKELESRMPASFSEVKKYTDLTNPTEFLRLSKKIGACSKYDKYWTFITATSFNAWLSNNFSKSYGRKEKVSRPIYKQVERELDAFGSAAEAAAKISFESLSKAECATLKKEIDAYSATWSAL